MNDAGAPIPEDPQLGPVEPKRDGHDRFDRRELAIVLSHYDIGPIDRITRYPRGSRRAPKVRIESSSGVYLLKRRAPGRDDAARISFTEDLYAHLVAREYPVAPIVRTRDGQHAVLQRAGRAYELFRYIRGKRDDGSAASAQEAGAALGRLHGTLDSMETEAVPTSASFHGDKRAARLLECVPAAIARAVGVIPDSVRPTCEYLGKAYRRAAQRVTGAGLDALPGTVIHGDWHPGNLIYREGRIEAVLDFDSSRIEPRIVDLANGALQFGMTSSRIGDDPDVWPSRLDLDRTRALIRGYEEENDPLTTTERAIFPWLLIEALVVESVAPIAQAGQFAHLDGAAFLAMVERKIRWIETRADRILVPDESPPPTGPTSPES